MASIHKRPDGRWRARYRDDAGREHARHFTRKVDATRWLDEVTTAVVTGAYVDPKAGRVTVGATAAAWLHANPSWSETTRARNHSVLMNHVLPRWGQVPLSRVTFEDVQAWVAGLSSSGMTGGTVRKVVGALSSVLALAVKSRRLAANPAQGIDLPKQALTGRRYLTVEQTERLAEASGPHRDIPDVLSYCGLRIGELAAMKIRHVDLLRRRFRVEESVTEVNGRLVWSSPKDHQRRSVPFPAFLSEPLSVRIAGKGPDDLIFPSARGGVLRVRNMRRGWFDMAAAEAGAPGLTPHELRHTAASLAVSAGASVLALQRMLGHDKPSTTLDVYSDLFDEDLDAVSDRLSAARERILADYLRTEPATELHASAQQASDLR